MGTKGGYKRTILLINPKFQLTIMAYIIGLTMVTSGIIFMANRALIQKSILTAQSLALPPEHVAFQLLNEQRESMTVIFGLTVVIVFCCMALGGMILSHRVAGPLYRLRQHLLAVSRGETTRDVTFRDKDYFIDLRDACNEVMKRLREQPNPALESRRKPGSAGPPPGTVPRA